MNKWSRRSALSAMAGVVACAATDSPVMPRERAHESLGRLAAVKGLLFGAAMMIDELSPESRTLFAQEVRLVTPSNELKMTGVRPNRATVDFADADAIIAFADEHGLQIRGHTLIWNNYLPRWVHGLSKGEIEGLIDSHIDLLCGRYRGRIHSWDVVNEPLGTESGEKNWLAHGPYFDALGPEYIARSFLRARAADPTAKLLLNETHTERDDALGYRQRKRLLRLIDELQHAGIPLDGIGLQGHLEPPAPLRPDAFLSFCEEIAGRGLEIQITELDVADDHFPDDIATRDALVAEAMYKFLSAALRCKAVKVAAIWHLADKHSFPYRQAIAKAPFAKRRPRPLLFDDEQKRKPAWDAVAQAFSEMPPRQ